MTPECTGMNRDGTEMNENNIGMNRSVLCAFTVHSRRILGHSGSFRYHSGSFRFTPVYSVSVFSISPTDGVRNVRWFPILSPRIRCYCLPSKIQRKVS